MSPVKVYSKRNLIIALIFLAAAIGYPLYLYLAPAKKVEQARTDIRITAFDMLAAFESDKAAAEEHFSGKVLEVNGVIHKVEDAGAVPVVFFDQGGNYVIVANMLEQFDEKDKLVAGEMVTLKGKYSGVIVNPQMYMIPADIKIEQCTVVK
jgi:hypothetical protein